MLFNRSLESRPCARKRSRLDNRPRCTKQRLKIAAQTIVCISSLSPWHGI